MKIKIKGVIISNDDQWIYDWFEIDSVSPKQVEEQIEKASGEDLEIEINSPGGDVYAGSEIYTMLKEYAGNVIVKIVGIAASAASVIAMSGKKVMISPTAQIMIHNVWSLAMGDYREMEHAADVLKGWNKSIANAYMLKTGMSQKELLSLMNKESWLTAQEALEKNFVDEVMFDDTGTKLAASIAYGMLPQEVVSKIRNFVKKDGPPDPTPEPTKNVFDQKLNELKSFLEQTLLSANKDQIEQARGIFNELLTQLPKPEAKGQLPVDLYNKLCQINERRLTL